MDHAQAFYKQRTRTVVGIMLVLEPIQLVAMFGPLVSSIENAFLQFNLRRLFYLLFVVGVLVGGLYVFDSATDYSFYIRYDNRLSALERLQQIQYRGIPSELSPIYNDLVSTLHGHDQKPIVFTFNYAPFLKVVTASLFYWIMVLYGFVHRVKGEADWDSLVIGGFTFGAISTVLALAIPTLYNPWVNASIYAAFQVACILMISRYGSRIKADSASA